MTPRQEDLTGRARIRDAALAEFAARGTAGATIRGIAGRAGVSPTLVQHHFGTKAGLRAACDEFVLDYLRARVDEGIARDRIDDPVFIAETHRSAPAVLHYLARALVDGSPAAATVFDELVAITEQYLDGVPAETDAHTRAVILVSMRLGPTVLHEHVTRGLGTELFGPSGATATGRATLDLIAPDLVPGGPDRLRDGLDKYAQEQGEADR